MDEAARCVDAQVEARGQILDGGGLLGQDIEQSQFHAGIEHL
jgi:hypothetical protein